MGRQNTAACWSWRWKSMSQAKLRSAGPEVVFARWLSLLSTHVCRLTDLKTLQLNTGASTVLLTQ